MKKLICLILLINLTAFAQQKTTKLQFGVLDESESFFNDLKIADVQILQDKKPLQINSFELKNDVPLEVIFLIDASASQEKTISDEKKFAEQFIDGVLKKDKDEVSVFKFSGKISLEQDLTNDFAKAKEQLAKVQFIPPAGYIGGGIIVGNPPVKNSDQMSVGATSIYDSIKQVSEMFAQLKPNDSRKVIIVISDGINTYGKSKLENAIEAALKNQISVYAIGIGDENYGGVDKKALKKLTEQTNGISVFPKKKLEDLPQQIKKIEQSLRSVYETTFTANSKDGLQEIKIEIINEELRKRKLQIIQPKGFYNP